jgi:hypothetical protein
MPREERRRAASFKRDEPTTNVTQRLGVVAQQADFGHQAKETRASRLSNAFGIVSPALKALDKRDRDAADLARVKQEEADGGQRARAGGRLDGTEDGFFQSAFMQTKGALEGRRDARAVHGAAATTLDLDEAGLEDWIVEQRTNLTSGIEDFDYLANYNRELDATFETIRNEHFENNANIVKEETDGIINGEVEELLVASIDAEATAEELMSHLDGIYSDAKKNFNKEFRELDDIVVPNIIRYAIETANPDVLDIFEVPKADGTPGLAQNPRFLEAISTARIQAFNAREALDRAKDAEAKKGREERSDQLLEEIRRRHINGENVKSFIIKNLGNLEPTDEGIALKLIDDFEFTGLEDPVVRASLKYDISIGAAGRAELKQALNSRDITPKTFETLLGDIKSFEDSADTTSVFKTDDFKFGVDQIKRTIGKQSAFGTFFNSQEAQKQSDALQLFRDEVAALENPTPSQIRKIQLDVQGQFANVDTNVKQASKTRSNFSNGVEAIKAHKARQISDTQFKLELKFHFDTLSDELKIHALEFLGLTGIEKEEDDEL